MCAVTCKTPRPTCSIDAILAGSIWTTCKDVDALTCASPGVMSVREFENGSLSHTYKASSDGFVEELEGGWKRIRKWLPTRKSLVEFFLPIGWPDSVAPEYLRFQLW